MEEALPYFQAADAHTLAIFDIDMVLVQPSDPAFQMANMKRHSTICKGIMKQIPPDKQMIFLSLMTVRSSPVLIDPRMPEYLNHIMQSGCGEMALTANLTGELDGIQNMQERRIESLRALGIDFSKAAPYHQSIVFDNLASYRGNYSVYLDGILFVNGTVVSKGEALVAFLQKTKSTPTKIIFIDDREENLKDLEVAIKKLDRPIAYQGLHFLGAQKYPSTMLTEQEFEARWKELASAAMSMS